MVSPALHGRLGRMGARIDSGVHVERLAGGVADSWHFICNSMAAREVCCSFSASCSVQNPPPGRCTDALPLQGYAQNFTPFPQL